MSVQSVVSLVLEGEDKGMSDVLSGAAGGVGNLMGTVAGLAGIGAVAGGIIAVGSALSNMADMAGAAESTLSNVQIRTGATTDEMDGLKETIFDIRSSGLGDSFEGVADSLGTVRAITQATDDELQSMTTNAVLLSEVFDYDVAESTRAVDTAMENFGTTSQNTFDLIVAGYQRTGDPAGDLLDTINEYSADFAEAGFGANEFFGILVAGADAGAFNLDKVADSVREFTTRVVDGSVPTRAALDDIGIGADNLYEQFADGSLTVADSLGLVIGKLREMRDPIAQDAAGVALFGSLWEDLGKEAIFALDSGVTALGEYQGAAQAAFDTATSGLQNTQAQAEAAKEQYQILIGEAILPLKLEYYELANAILTATIESRERGEALAEEDDAARNTIDLLYEQTAAMGGLKTTLGDTSSEEATAEAIEAINAAINPWSGSVEDAAANNQALNQALILLQGGFQGTGRDLAAAALEMLAANDAYGTFSETNKDLTFQTQLLMDANGLLVDSQTGLIVSADEAAAALDREAAASERAGQEAQRAADAEAYRAEQVRLAADAVTALHDTMAAGFDQSLGILEQGGQLESLNDVIYNIGKDSGFSALELATMKVAMGEASDQAIIDALKFEIIRQAIVNMAAAAQEDGRVTADEISNMIDTANDLQLALDEQFEFAFESKGMDAVLGAAGNLIGDLENATAAPYDIVVNADTDIVAEALAGLRRDADELTAFDRAVSFSVNAKDSDKTIETLATAAYNLTANPYLIEMDDNTTTVTANVIALEDVVKGVVAPEYVVDMDSNAPAVQADVSNLRGALDALDGRTIRIRIEADTSGVPPWAIPHSPLPIHTAWLEFAADMENMRLRPDVAADTRAGAAVAPVAAGGQAGGQLIVYGDVIVGGASDEARMFKAFLEKQLQILER